MALTRSTQDWLRENGFLQRGNAWVGQVGGYLFTVIQANMSLVNILVSYASCNQDELRDALKADKKAKQIVNFSVAQKRATIMCRQHKDPSYIHNAIHAAAASLARAGATDMTHCAKCGMPASEQVWAGNHAEAMCNPCAQKGTREGNPVLGLVGAILGGVVGMIPWIVVGMTLDIISMWLAFLVAFLAFWGYKLFARGVARYSMWIVAPIALICALGAHVILMCLYYELPFTTQSLVALIEFAKITPALMEDFVFVLMFALAGTIVGMTYMHGSILRPLAQRIEGPTTAATVPAEATGL